MDPFEGSALRDVEKKVDEIDTADAELFPIVRATSGSVSGFTTTRHRAESDAHSHRSAGTGPTAGRSRAMSAVDVIVENTQFVSQFASMWVCNSPLFIFKVYFSRIAKRAFWYAFVLIVLSLVLFSHGTNGRHNTIWGVSVSDWYSFVILFCFVDLCTTTLDHFIFYFIDNFWCGEFHVAYTLHAFKGPLGWFLLIVIVENGMGEMAVARAISDFNLLISTAVTVLICYAIKNYFQHVRYIDVLERRFADRLVKLDQYRHILSTLASNRVSRLRKPRAESFSSAVSGESNEASSSSGSQHGAAVVLSPGGGTGPSVAPSLASVPEHEITSSSPNRIPFSAPNEATTTQPLPPASGKNSYQVVQNDNDDTESVRNPILGMGQSETSDSSGNVTQSGWRSAIPFFTDADGRLDSSKVRDVFIEIVADDSHGENEDDAKLSAKKLFWARMSELNEGTLKFMTYNGTVRINKRKQARVFGEKLYVHLSREGKCIVTNLMLREAIKKNFGAHGGDNILRAHDRSGAAQPLMDRAALKEARKKELDTLITEANLLFRMGKEDDEMVTEDAVVKGVLQVYKEMKFATSSLYDFGGLQQSLRYVIDAFFWIAMTVVAQCILQYDLSTVFAPGVTLVVVISFALGPFFGNLFLAIGFTFFMLPFDIGDRVMIGPPGANFICFITTIGLLQTTVHTIYGEKLVLANHTLFSEKIINCAESAGVSYEIIVHFNMEGPSYCSQEKIDAFVQRVVHFCMVEHKDEWKDCWPIASGLDTGANKFAYSFWVTHHCSTQQILRVIAARTEFYKYLRTLAHEMEISFTSPMLPVYTIPERKSTEAETFSEPSFFNSSRRKKID